jgi:hypothetical protein
MWWTPIVAAVITGPVVVVLQKLRRENTGQHNESRHLLEHLVIKVDRIGDKLDNHITEHHDKDRRYIA